MQLLTIPNKILTSKAEEVADFSGIKSIAEEMISIASANNLVGLAGNQVGFLQRIFIMQIDGKFETIINPIIKRNKTLGQNWGWEGCGSIPALECLVERFNSIDIIYKSYDGENKSMNLTWFNARVAQHEEDHLWGVMMTTKARQRRFRK